MNTKRFLVSWAAVFAFVFFYEYLLHGQLLVGMYEQTAHLWRSAEDSKMEFIFISQILFAALVTFLFTRNYENKGVKEGLRFGFYLGLLLGVIEIGKYCYMPIPGNLVLSWMVGVIVEGIGAGVVVSLVYRE